MSVSRRKRRRALKSERKSSLRKWLWKIPAGFILLLLFLCLGVYFYITSYFKSDEFKALLEQKASETINGEVSLTPIERDGRFLRVDSINVHSSESIVSEAAIQGFDVEINYPKLLDRILLISKINIKSAQIKLENLPLQIPVNDQAVDQAVVIEEVELPMQDQEGFRKYLPNKVELSHVNVQDLSLLSDSPFGQVMLQGVKTDIFADMAKNSYRAQLKGGKFSIPWKLFPKGELDIAELRYNGDSVSILELKVEVGEKGRLAMEGEWSLGREPSDLNMALQGITLEEVLPPDWIKSLEGNLKATCRLRRSSLGEMTYNGDLSINNGILTALPVLDTLAAFAGTSRFRRIDWSTAQSDYKYENNRLEFYNIFLASEGLIRIEGNVVIEGELLSGNLMVGIPPGLLSHIPGAEEVVFTTAHNNGKLGLLWAPVQLSGTTIKPKEDLSNRLITAAGDRLFRKIPGGGKVLNFTRSIADQLLNPGSSDEQDDDQKKKETSPVKVGQDLLKSGLEIFVK